MSAIDRKRLFVTLGFTGQKIPETAYGTSENVPCYSVLGDFIDSFTVIVEPGGPQKKQLSRVFILCPICQAKIPFGRFHQHFKSKVCLAKEQAFIESHSVKLDQYDLEAEKEGTAIKKGPKKIVKKPKRTCSGELETEESRRLARKRSIKDFENKTTQSLRAKEPDIELP
jgi:hypothetical protein